MSVSMTGFAARKGQGHGYVWAWDMRAVNGKGLDLRLRLPDWVEGLELALRADLQKALTRGNVSVNLRLSRDAEGVQAALALNPVALASVMAAMRKIGDAAAMAGLPVQPVSPAEILSQRGVVETNAVEEDTAPLRQALLADFALLLADFQAARASEGAALNRAISSQLDQIDALVAQAKPAAAARAASAAEQLQEAVAKLMGVAEGIDPLRLAQELALLAVKQDITEELDRLAAHIDAARVLLAQDGPIGRKFDFLMQEFMREANTMCSKAQDLALTRIGLDLKTLIDQMREQVQNVE